MSRPFIFLSGEFRITLPIVFSNDLWLHSMKAKNFVFNDKDLTFNRENIDEILLGCIYYASVSDEKIRKQNFNFLIEHNIPCWPNPSILLSLDDRHEVMKKVIDANLLQHNIVQGEQNIDIPFPYPFVVKTGNEHRGEGKFLVSCQEDLPKWEGVATIEPFFKGTSCRVLWAEDNFWGLRFDNNTSWIKNSSGAEVSLYSNIPKEVVEHSKKIKDLFGLEVCGIDYIVNEKSGEWWFLEYNQFPGVDVDDSITLVVNEFFQRKMKEIEEASSRRMLMELSEELGLY